MCIRDRFGKCAQMLSTQLAVTHAMLVMQSVSALQLASGQLRGLSAQSSGTHTPPKQLVPCSQTTDAQSRVIKSVRTVVAVTVATTVRDATATPSFSTVTT